MEFPRAPLDDEGFVQSFTLEQKGEIESFFSEFGFVIVQNVLNAEQCAASIDEIWRSIEQYPTLEHPRIDRNNKTTWINDVWPNSRQLGILGDDPAMGKQAWENRQNENVFEVFKLLHKTDRLRVTFDRYGILRPTRENPEWKTVSDWLHWDLGPWNYKSSSIYFVDKIPNNEKVLRRDLLKVQGLVALVDTREEDGGFQTVPAFSKYFFDWAELNKDTEFGHKYKNNKFVRLPKDEANQHIWNSVQRIPMRAGSLLVWNSKQVHCNYPNNSDRFRMCQYIKMVTEEELIDEGLERRFPVDIYLPKNFEMNNIGRTVFAPSPVTEVEEQQNNTTNSRSCEIM
eukprot:TRINITY_DN800_c0_g1_i3.p1 TRINITY_DN800_c0_g1~~TRINITY_DN800_c0_g1_i3.p1  ORF type:complete len:342 (-),score=64.70 TRINITY_DN800_c0_g1_i3:108-1133(-)